MPEKSFNTICVSVILMFILSCNGKKGVSDSETKPVIKRATIDEIEAGIKHYIQTKTKANDGYFLVADRGKEFKMKLVRVHTEYLSSLGPNRQFACVDLADISGDVYDVDFFLEGQPGEIDVTETTVHKLNGKPFYAWKQKKDKTWDRVPVKNASNRLLGVIEGKDEFEFTYRVALPEIMGKGHLWMPMATSDSYQTIDVISISVPVEYKVLTDKEFNNSIIYMELSSVQSNKTIEIAYAVKRKEKGPVEEEAPVTGNHLEDNLLMPVGGRFTDLAKAAVKGRDGSDLIKARALYDYVIDNMKYMKFGNYGRGDSNYACDVKTGNCTEFHSYFISLARSIGIPARFAVGVSIPSERNEGGIDGYHCWAEFYAEGKWWPIDISEANKYSALATYYFGHHPANRIEFSRGRDLKVKPGPASGPINFLAYPILEVNGNETPAKTTFLFKRPGGPAL